MIQFCEKPFLGWGVVVQYGAGGRGAVQVWPYYW